LGNLLEIQQENFGEIVFRRSLQSCRIETGEEDWFLFLNVHFSSLLGGLVDGGDNNWGSVSVATSGLRRVDGGALVGHLSHETVSVVSGILGGLDTAVGEGDHEGALDNTGSILCLGLLEVIFAVVIGDSILISEGLGGKLLWSVGYRGGAVGGRGAGSESGSHKGRGKDKL
jgi:hypothetical protein